MPNPIKFFDDDENLILIKTRWDICYDCNGDGTRALGGMAITQDEWSEWDQDERDDYFDGGYDSPCETCNCSGKVAVPDDLSNPQELLEVYESHLMRLHQYDSIDRQERAMGC